MSTCTFTIYLNGLKLEASVESSEPSVLIGEDFVKVLKDNPEILDLITSSLEEDLYNNSKKQVTLKELKETGIQANCTLDYLKSLPEFSDLYFPDVKANILLVDNLKLNDKTLTGRVINSNGEEIFILKGSTKDVLNFLNFLKIREKVRSENILLSEESPYYKDFEELLKILKKKKNKESVNSVSDVIIDFLLEKQAYSNIFLTSGNSAVRLIENFVRNLGDYDLPNTYDDNFVADLYERKYNLGHGLIQITYNDFKNILNNYYPELANNFILNSKEDVKLLTDIKINSEKGQALVKWAQEKNIDLEKLGIDQDTSILGALFKILLSPEPDFTYKYEGCGDNGIFLKQAYSSVSDKYDVSFETILLMKLTPYKGYTIYSDDHNIFISRGTLTQDSLSDSYKTVEDAIAEIEKRTVKANIYKNSLLEFKFRERVKDELGNFKWITGLNKEKIKSPIFFKAGLVIPSLDVNIDSSTKINGNEQILISPKYKSTIIDFYNVVDSWEIDDDSKFRIKLSINNAEKVAAYIYKINEILGDVERNDLDLLLSIAKDITNSKINYYYVESSQKATKDLYEYKVIPINNDEFSEYKKQLRKPVTLWLSAISTVLNRLFGVPINLVTSEEVNEMFKNTPHASIDKAFIYNGEVYVNTTTATTEDLLHEHVHLILGILKSNPDLRQNYENLLNHLSGIKLFSNTVTKLKEIYPELSTMDLREEAFATLFSAYLRGEISIDTLEVFDTSQEIMKKAAQYTFNTTIDKVDSFYSSQLNVVFSRFNRDVRRAFQENEMDFGSTLKSRRISSWISKQILEGNLKEENC